MAALPLAVRKQLRDEEPKAKEFLDKIKGVLGVTLTVELEDPGTVYAAIPANSRDNFGYTVFTFYMRRVADRIQEACGDDLAKGVFLSAVSKNKIVFQIKKEFSENGTKIADGVLYVQIALSEYDGTAGVLPYLESKLNDTTKGSGGLPLDLQQGIKANESYFKTAMDRIEKAIGFRMAFEVENIRAIYDKTEERYRGNLGETIYSKYATAAAEAFENECKDDMVKEALVDGLKAKKIVFRVDDSIANWACDNKIVNGVLVLTYKHQQMMDWQGRGEILSEVVKNL